MMSRVQRVLLTMLTLGVFFTVLWVSLSHDPRHFESPLINKAAPHFKAPSAMDKSKQLTDSIWKGHVTVLNVFASWCETCAVEHLFWMDHPMPKGVQLVALDYMDTPAHVQGFLKDRGNPFSDVISDSKGTLGIDLGVYGVPETYLIDAKGMIRFKRVGAMTMDHWKQEWLPRINTLRGVS